MKALLVTSLLTLVTASAFAGDFQCKYSLYRNSTSQKKQITPETSILPTATIRLDDPSSGNLRARLAKETVIDGHKLRFMGLLNQRGKLNMSITDDTSIGGMYAFTSVSNAQKDQVIEVQYNFWSTPTTITLITETCSFTE